MTNKIIINRKPTLIYNFYNLDPQWKKYNANRILLIEPSVFENYPISKKSMEFMINFRKTLKIYKYMLANSNN